MALASVSWRGYRSFVRRFNFSWRARPRHHHPRRWMLHRYLAGVVTSQSFYIHPSIPALPPGRRRPLANGLLRGHFIQFRLSFRVFRAFHLIAACFDLSLVVSVSTWIYRHDSSFWPSSFVTAAHGCVWIWLLINYTVGRYKVTFNIERWSQPLQSLLCRNNCWHC